MNRSLLQLIHLTPPGRGAVATLRVEGAGALAVVTARLSTRGNRPLADFAVDRLVIGHFGGRDGEEVVVRRQSDGSIDLHCHGGLAAVARIEQILVEAGCRVLAWQDWAAGHADDPIAAAARIALAEARTQRTAAILLDQYHGALRRALEEIETALGAGESIVAQQRIDTLLARAPLGLHLVQPWRIVVAGQPNVGKSSLINAMAGYQRAIVHAAPGTTRDVVTVQTAVDGWPVELSDTAGLHAGGDAVERAGIELARREMVVADLVVLVFDRSREWSDVDRALLQSQPGALIVHNKCDLASGPGARSSGVLVSAVEPQGIDGLCRAIADRLVPSPPLPGAAVPFTPSQVEQIVAMASRCRKT